MKMLWTAAATAGAMALAGCASDGMGGGSARAADAHGAMAAAATPTTAMGYVAEAARSDMYEIQSGQLAQQKASSDAVRSFGGMLVTDHTATTQMIMQAVQSAGMTPPPPPPLDARRQGMLTALRNANGAAFDRLFLQQQVMAHQEALALHEGYARGGDAPALKTVAAQIAPKVAQHLQAAQGMRP